MKQKYTLSIADMQINVVTEASRESVDKIVGMLDRKMREIILTSKKCPKNEAALLCALEFCADKLAMKEELESLEETIVDKNKEIAFAEKKIAKLEDEIAKLRASAAAARTEAPVASKEEVQLTIEVAEPAPASDPEPAAEIAAEPAPQKKKSRNKVGSMFDLLTFSDI